MCVVVNRNIYKNIMKLIFILVCVSFVSSDSAIDLNNTIARIGARTNSVFIYNPTNKPTINPSPTQTNVAKPPSQVLKPPEVIVPGIRTITTEGNMERIEPSHNHHNHEDEDSHSTDETPSGPHTIHFHEEPRILNPKESDLILSNATRTDLCSKCLCTPNFQQVVCEYTRSVTKLDTLVLTKDNISREAKSIQIRGYTRVIIEPKTFADDSLQLRLLALENIKEIILKNHSLQFGPNARINLEIVIQIKNSKIPKFPTLSLTQSLVGRHGKKQYKLEKARFLSVEINGCSIGTVEKHAIYEARLLYFNISSSQIMVIEPKAIDLDVYEMVKLHNNTLPRLPHEAFCFHAKKVIFSGNEIKKITNHSIIIETDGQVLFEYNKVNFLEANGLAGITPRSSTYGASIVFLMNHVDRTEPKSLYINDAFPAHERRVLNNSFQIDCACNISTQFELMMGIEIGEMYDKASYENALENSLCVEPVTRRYIYIDLFMKDDCKPFPVALVSAVVTSVVLFVIAITVCVIYSLRLQHAKEEANMLGECTSQSFSTLSRNYYDQGMIKETEQLQNPPFAIFPWVAAVPEVKTYQQSQLPELTEQTESICGSTRGSLREPLSEFERRVLARASCPFN